MKKLSIDENKCAEAFGILNRRFAEYEYSVDIRADEMRAEVCSVDEFLQLPSAERRRGERNYTAPTPIPYWYAFLEPPQGTPYLNSDFAAFNDVLFPNREDMEIYRWNDGFSDYFDVGKEWWGTGLWSAYDKKADIMVVIGASLTD